MAPLSILVAIAILPVILICLFVYSKDKDKEPINLLIRLFFSGIISCFLVLLLSLIGEFIPFLAKDTNEMGLFQVIVYSFINVALVEEFFKWIMVYNLGYKSKHFDQLYDIVVYAVFVSLGFAFLENLLYVLPQGTIKVGIIRALLAVPGHACDAIFMGYYLSIARLYKYKNSQITKKNIYLSIIVPTILHGTYDFCLFASIPALLIIFFVFITILYVFSINKLNTISKELIKDNFFICPRCGTKVRENFCPHCNSIIQNK